MQEDGTSFGNDLIELLEASPIGAVILDSADRVLFWNSPLLDILGGLQGDAFNMAAASAFFLLPRDFEAAKEAMHHNGGLTGVKTRLLRADGMEAWASVSLRPIRFEGQPATLLWYFDITDQQLKQAALELSQETLLEVLDASPFGVALVESNGLVGYWNAALIDVVGAADSADPSEAIRSAVAAAQEAVRQLGEGVPHQLDDGRWVTAWRRVVRFEGRPATLLWLNNVTALRHAQDEAERATRSKSTFLATMSHEIRTPMNGVRTMAELLLDTALTPDQAKMVGTIADSSDALIAIINDILDFSKIEAGKLELSPRAFRLEALLDGVAQLLRPKTEEKGLNLTVALDQDGARWVLGDDMRLRQVLLNLVGNAIKFTERGTVRIECRGRGDRVTFTVADTGIGIPADKLRRLFVPFNQADASTARRFGGTGLGLSICKGLIDLMHGTITAESEPGWGTRFTVTITLPPTDAPLTDGGERMRKTAARWAAPPRDQVAQHRGVILCAEDNPTNRDVLSRVLDRLGFVADFTQDGAEALERLDRGCHGLLLTDGHMPGVDGWELCRRIRAQEAADGLPRLPVIALTADAVRGVEEQCRQAGMDGYLTKPLVIDRVEEELLTHLPILATLRQVDGAKAESQRAVFGVGSDVLDIEMLSELVGDDAETLDSLLQSFLSSADGLTEETLTHLGAEDATALRASAHSLKGAAGYVGAKRLAEAAGAVETAAAQGRLEEARRWAPALRPLLEEVQTAIEKMRVEDQLRRIRAEIGELAEQGEGLKGGLELEAVVGITESAADRILAAAETILARVDMIGTPAEAEAIQTAVMAIFEACSFQDLTSQRVRKAIARLSAIEERLEAVVRGTTDDPNRRSDDGMVDQAEVDALFGSVQG
ncbi:MAG: hypothetical protein RLY86_2745 [Pseudomonadota bacterium]|jgi:PAS domain S-box-containing protein